MDVNELGRSLQAEDISSVLLKEPYKRFYVDKMEISMES